MPRALVRAGFATALLALTALIAGCTGAPMPTPSSSSPSASPAPVGDGVLTIGTLLPSSGSTAFLGAAQVAGVNAAVRELNAAGGYKGAKIQVISRNSGDASTDTAEKSFAQLVEKGVDVVIGPSSSAIAERLLAPAAAAGIPLISPSATYPQLTDADTTDSFFRTIPSYPLQGTALGSVLGAKSAKVALIYVDDELGRSLRATLAASLDENGGSLVAEYPMREGIDTAALIARAKVVSPDAVVLVTPDNGTHTKTLIRSLTSAGLGGSKLWLTSQNTADYSRALKAGLLRGVNGIIESPQPDKAFAARLKQEDPGVRDRRYGPEAYDAVVLAALAAVLADDDSGASITQQLRAAASGGIKCTSYGECLDVLTTESDIDYDGITGSLSLDAAGDRSPAVYGLYIYGRDNKFKETGTASA